MSNMADKNTCNCPIECNTIGYTSYFVSSPFKPDELCPTKEPAEGLMKEFYVHKTPPQLVRNLEMYAFNFSSQAQDYCKSNIQYRAEVNFQLATNTMSVTVITRRLSFFDKLSGFGILKFSHKTRLSASRSSSVAPEGCFSFFHPKVKVKETIFLRGRGWWFECVI